MPAPAQAVPVEHLSVIRAALADHEYALRSHYDAEPDALAAAAACRAALAWLDAQAKQEDSQ